MEKGDKRYAPRHNCGGPLVDRIIAVNEEIFGCNSVNIPQCTGCGLYIATGFLGKKEKAEFKDPESAVNYILGMMERKPRLGY